ncbi:MAG: hypothetical protein BYD32DRAFT_462309 [Podila humilis]|nr:MAG: hypothetical protein BYD32DRAFT_462309 [Podila humilis]
MTKWRINFEPYLWRTVTLCTKSTFDKIKSPKFQTKLTRHADYIHTSGSIYADNCRRNSGIFPMLAASPYLHTLEPTKLGLLLWACHHHESMSIDLKVNNPHYGFSIFASEYDQLQGKLSSAPKSLALKFHFPGEFRGYESNNNLLYLSLSVSEPGASYIAIYVPRN